MNSTTSICQHLKKNAETHGEQPALIENTNEITWSQLYTHVQDAARKLGAGQKLVLLQTTNTSHAIIWYLACLLSEKPTVLTSGDTPLTEKILKQYNPDVILDTTKKAEHQIQRNRDSSPHSFHKELAILLSTSGSTGSAKLVKLSHQNLANNADSIATYLQLTPKDRAITTLPMHYCYGLSIVNSHIAAAAGIVLNTNSVVDKCFWNTFTKHNVTSLSGVPHTFTLLEQANFSEKNLPSLRYLTQAGGKLQPEKIQQFAKYANQKHAELFVMYGQTEATARMAYLPPQQLAQNPNAIGQAIPGGSLWIEPSEEENTNADDNPIGELLYEGPNVMMGYAEKPADLLSTNDSQTLRTGDLAKVNKNGFFEVVGRKSRFIKPFGLRIDLDNVESFLASNNITAFATGDDTHLVIACTHETNPDTILQLLKNQLNIPANSIKIHVLNKLPRLPNTKPDYQTILHQDKLLNTEVLEKKELHTEGDFQTPTSEIISTFSKILNKKTIDTSKTFAELGGDSLNYVEASITLQESLGHLETDWHTKPLTELLRTQKPPIQNRRAKFFTQVDSLILLRCVAIILIAATHIGLVSLPGGSHVLLAAAGYNFARFQLQSKQFKPSIIQIALPYLAWITLLTTTTHNYDLSNFLFFHNIFGQSSWSANWQFWFLDVLLQTLIGFALLFQIKPIQKFENNHATLFALLFVAASVFLRFDLFDWFTNSRAGARTPLVVWLFALGWAAQKARTHPMRLLLSAITAISIYGFFNNPTRETIIFLGILLLLWTPTVPLWKPLTRIVTTMANASLWIYLTHWSVYPWVRDTGGEITALAASLLLGIAAWKTWTFMQKRFQEYRLPISHDLPLLSSVRPRFPARDVPTK